MHDRRVGASTCTVGQEGAGCILRKPMHLTTSHTGHAQAQATDFHTLTAIDHCVLIN